MVLKPKFRAELAKTITDNSNADFSIRNGLPVFGNAGVDRLLLKALDGRFIRPSRRGEPQASSNPAQCSQKRTARAFRRQVVAKKLSIGCQSTPGKIHICRIL